HDVDLLHGQPTHELVMMRGQHLPRLAATIAAVRADRLDHRADELIAELVLTAVAIQAERDRGVDIAAHGLAINRAQPLDRAEPLLGQPQPQNFTNLEHPNLPKRHRRSPIPLTRTATTRPAAAPALVDPGRWSHDWRA